MANPDVSVVMPIYNGENYMEQSIRSVLDQSLENFELLIMDDCSRDRTAEVALSFKDDRIVVRRAEVNRGLFYNLNRLIEVSNAPLIKLWSHDDIMVPTCLEQGLQFFREHPELGCFYGACDTIGPDGTLIETPPHDSTPIVLSPEVADRYSLHHGCLSGNIANLFFPTTIFSEVGYFQEDSIAADFEMMVRIQEKHFTGRIAAILVHLRKHSKQWSSAPESFLRFLREDLQIYETLKRRLLYEHRSMSEAEIQEILRRKFARNYFHGALRRLVRGQPESAFEALRLLGPAEFSSVGWWWLRDLPRRMEAAVSRK
jgi:glycosyltransferase involved in cell wall biosynthesis